LQLILEAYVGLLADVQGTPLAAQLGADPAEESFRLAEAARARTVSQALAASSARAAAKDPELADLARREQDAQKQIGALYGLLSSMLAAPSDQQDQAVLKSVRTQIDGLRGARAKLREDIERRFPDYVDLIDPKPPTVEQARAALKPGEALLSAYVGADRVFVWAVPQNGPVVFAARPVPRARIAGMVRNLRKALDPDAATLSDIPAFDVKLAHALYQILLQPVEAGWRDAKSLLVVPDRALGQIPFALLVTAPHELNAKGEPLFAAYRAVPWLLRQMAVTQLPSVNSLITLRKVPPGDARRLPFIGFGDPWFSKQQMAEVAAPGAVQTRGLRLVRRSAPATRTVDSAELAQLPRLPDTADEVKGVALALHADPGRDVFLGRDANERAVKTTDLSGRKVVMFATHGLVPGDLNGLTQPALALSAPDVADVDGDGLLTIDEILALRLNADWVVLSACNTASGDGAGAEAVSGLGRAFFYAGTRALLVSNWPVETTSARALTTDLFRRQADDPTLTRAEALRSAMLGLIDGPGAGQFTYGHPIFWAPFTLVGDGG
jgi:CHAT domain-containing protein